MRKPTPVTIWAALHGPWSRAALLPVEVPVWASKKGLSPVHVGALPPQLAILTGLSAQTEEMAVEAGLTGNPRLVYQAIAHDPLTAAVLSLAEIRTMVNEMFEQNRNFLPQFKHFKV